MITDTTAPLLEIQGFVYLILLVHWLFALGSQGRLSDRKPAWLLVSGVCGMLYGLAATQSWGLAFVGTAFAIGLCISAAMIHPTAAACLLTASLFLRPWELVANDFYLGLLPRLSFGLCLAHLLLSYVARRRIDFSIDKQGLLLIALALWCFLATLVAPDPGLAQSAYFDSLFKCVLLYFMITQLVRTPAALEVLVWTMLVSFLAVGAICLFETFQLQNDPTAAEVRLQGFGAFSNSNDIAALMVLIMPFAALRIFRQSQSQPARLLCFALTVVALAVVGLSRSRGAMLSLGLMFAVYTLLSAGRRAWLILLIGGVALAIPASIVLSNRSAEDLATSREGRATYFKAGLRMGAKNPLFGVGFDAYPVNLQHYATESLEESVNMTAHNSLILVFAEAGVLGFLFFLGAYLAALRSSRGIFRAAPEYLLATSGYGLSMFFLSHSYVIYPYLLYGLVHVASTAKHEAP